MAQLSERQQTKIIAEREMAVYKRDDMIQKARFSLSVQENRTILYLISKIKPNDNTFQEYTFDIKDFYRVIGWEKESYSEFKAMLLELRKKVWMARLPDETETAVSWLEVARLNKRSGKVTLGFHRDMMQYLLDLANQETFYTSYNLQYVLPMQSQYSPRLYEILKSYQKNNRLWFFDVEELKRLLDCQTYERWPDFRRRVLEPAVEEINKYTDISIAYTIEKEGRRVSCVNFYMTKKSTEDLNAATLEGYRALDKQLNIFEVFDK